MIIKTKDKDIPKGFLLQKDYLLSKLFLSKKKKVLPFKTLSFNISPIKTNLFLQININRRKKEEAKTRNLKSISVMSNFRSRLHLKRAFPPYFPSMHSNQNSQPQADLLFGLMEDDLNITSINSKKFFYSNRNDKSKISKRISEEHSGDTHLGKTTTIHFVPKSNNTFFTNERLKHINSRPLTGAGWFQTELPKAKG